MERSFIELNKIKLVGITARTSNDKEFNPQTAKISACIQQFFFQALKQILDRKKPGVTFCAYTKYESDYKGEYTFFVGEEVNEIQEIPQGMVSLIIPPQKYVKFTTNSGPMPNIVISSWQEIWKMMSQDLGGIRNYYTDFELYDYRAVDSQNAVVDIFIGVK